MDEKYGGGSRDVVEPCWGICGVDYLEGVGADRDTGSLKWRPRWVVRGGASVL
jgi:hypothetical protein